MILQVIEVHLSRLKTKSPKNLYAAYINENQYNEIFKDHIQDQQTKLFHNHPIIHEITIKPHPEIQINNITVINIKLSKQWENQK